MADEEYAYYIAILHPDRRRVFLPAYQTGERQLPELTDDTPETIAAAVRRAFGLEVVVLGRAHDTAGAARSSSGRQVRLLVAETRPGTDHFPQDGAWVDAETVRGTTLSPEELRFPLAAWLDAVASARLTGLPEAWARPGWFEQACSWIAEQVRRQGMRLTGPVCQVSVRAWSCVLRAPTDGGDLYFKAATPAFGFEPALSALLDDLAPGSVPHLLGQDVERKWMLLADGGASFRDVRPEGDGLVRWEELMRQLAYLQRRTAEDAERLVSLGCPDRRPASLPAQYDEFLTDVEALLFEQPDGVSAVDLDSLHTLRAQVGRMCAQLSASGVPATIHHDDLGPGNALLGPDGRFVYFDWAESAVAHPFCSLFIPLRAARLLYDAPDVILDRLRDAYLSCWPEYGTPQRLRGDFEIAHRLGSLLRALTWRAAVSDLGPTTRWQYADSSAYFLLHFLDGRE